MSTVDLYRMRNEFQEPYSQIFLDSYNRLRRALTLKLRAMNVCKEKDKMRLGTIGEEEDSENVFEESKKEQDYKQAAVKYQITAIALNKIDEESVVSSNLKDSIENEAVQIDSDGNIQEPADSSSSDSSSEIEYGSIKISGEKSNSPISSQEHFEISPMKPGHAYGRIQSF